MKKQNKYFLFAIILYLSFCLNLSSTQIYGADKKFTQNKEYLAHQQSIQVDKNFDYFKALRNGDYYVKRKNYKKAEYWFKLAYLKTRKGHPLVRLADFYSKTMNNYEKAAPLYKKALEEFKLGMARNSYALETYRHTKNFKLAIEINSTELDNTYIYQKVIFGYLYHCGKKYDKALKYYTDVLKESKNNFKTIDFEMAEIYKAMNNKKQAIKHYKMAISKGVSYANKDLALYYLSFDDYDNARECAQMEVEKNEGVANYLFGKIASKQNKSKEALNYFTIAARHENSDAIYELANIAKNNQEYTKALKLYTKEYKKNSNRAAYEIANMYKIKKDLVNALKWYKIAQKMGNNYASYSIGKIYLHSFNKPQTALKYLEKIAKKGEDQAIFEVGDYYLSRKNFDKAQSFYSQAINIRENFSGYLGLAKICEQKGDYEAAIGYFKKALENNVKAINKELALFYIRQKDFKNALTYAKKLEENDAGTSNYLYAKIASSQNDSDKAMIYYNKAVKLSNIEAIIHLASLAKKMQNFQEAIKLYIQAYQKDSHQAAYEIAMIYEKQNNYTDAEIWYEKAHINGNYEALLKLGYLYLNKLNKSNAGIKILEIFAKTGNINAIITIGDFYRDQKKYDTATKYYMRAIKKYNNYRGYIGIGEIFELAGKYDKAQKCYEKATKKNIPEAKIKLIALLNSLEKYDEARKWQ
ncbi:tetratricopeptide repeat protein [Lentisphaerota bacterium WC36G]|nr:tetratricopeptide repeat protein [Lentisphaerae bacterium WC36]